MVLFEPSQQATQTLFPSFRGRTAVSPTTMILLGEGGFILNEDGSYLLQEDGSRIQTEATLDTDFVIQEDGSYLLQEDDFRIGEG
jgi:hypothetical protein